MDHNILAGGDVKSNFHVYTASLTKNPNHYDTTLKPRNRKLNTAGKKKQKIGLFPFFISDVSGNQNNGILSHKESVHYSHY